MASFEKDFAGIQDFYPKLNSRRSDEPKGWIVSGELDICDQDGTYWDTFDIGIFIPAGYPYAVPTTMERSQLIPREIDWHISPKGVCCLDIDHNLLLAARKGLLLSDYLKNKVYPYFANQLHKRHKGTYAGEEYAHHFEGVIQFYREKLLLASTEQALSFINLVIGHHKPGRNARCPCGSGKKLKHCHQETLDILKDIGPAALKDDLAGFIGLKAAQYPAS